MVKFLQSSMGELVNVRWTVVMVKSIGAAIEAGGESIVDITNICTRAHLAIVYKS